MKLLLYCTKAKNELDRLEIEHGDFWYGCPTYTGNETPLNGKIVVECDCDLIEKIQCRCVPLEKENNLGYELFIENGVYKVEWKENINLVDEDERFNNPENYKNEGVVFEREDKYIDSMFKNSDLEKMCLTPQELLDYLKLGNNGYAIHLSNFKIFDEAKELSEFKTKQTCCKNSFGHLVDEYYPIKKSPQNMMKCFDKEGNEYILLSIQPQHLYNILNGDKIIEVRKKILNCMKELIR